MSPVTCFHLVRRTFCCQRYFASVNILRYALLQSWKVRSNKIYTSREALSHGDELRGSNARRGAIRVKAVEDPSQLATQARNQN